MNRPSAASDRGAPVPFVLGLGRALRQFVKAHVAGGVGLALCALVALMALFAPLLTPYEPSAQVLEMTNEPPWLFGGSLEHPLGTDQLGRDLATRVIFGARVSVVVGVAAVLLQGLLGVTLGLIAGYRGGTIDSIIMRVADVWLSMPFLIFAIAVMFVLGPGLLNTVVVLGIVGWVVYARIIRSEVLSLRQREYVRAAKGFGGSTGYILIHHILPNVSSVILVVGTLQVSRMILAEAALSFLGLGVQPPTPAWGNMIAQGRDYLYGSWWLATMPGVALLLTTLGLNLVGDALRDWFDPTLTRYGVSDQKARR